MRLGPSSAGDVKEVRIVLAVVERASTRPEISKNVVDAREPASVRVATEAVGLFYRLTRSNIAIYSDYYSVDRILRSQLHVVLHPDQPVLQTFSLPVNSATCLAAHRLITYFHPAAIIE